MDNKALIKHLEYQARIMRELHGVEAASPYEAALERARKLVEENETHCVSDGDWGRATGAAPEDEVGRDGWYIGR